MKYCNYKTNFIMALLSDKTTFKQAIILHFGV